MYLKMKEKIENSLSNKSHDYAMKWKACEKKLF